MTLFAAIWPQVAVAAHIGSGGSVTDRAAARSRSSRHLYVVDISNVVYRFPLKLDGLPATQPDGVLYPDGAVTLRGIAVDTVGHVFVADTGAGTVAEFASGAVGHQKPISILYVSGVDRLKFDDDERLYVHDVSGKSIAIFARGAHGHDLPISTVPPYNQQEFVIDYAISESGALYVINYHPYPMAVYNDPLHNPSQPDEFVRADGDNAFSWTLAMDEATDNLFVQFSVENPQYWNKINYDVRPASGTKTDAHYFIFTGDCGTRGTSIAGGSVVVNKYVIVSCYNDRDVLVYRSDQFGRQRAPVETLGQRLFASPWELAVGP
jgi:hypothetical protein